MSKLRRARVARNLTLEEAAERLNSITGGAADASLLSGWESGRKRTGMRNRAGLCELYGERPEDLFAHQDGERSASVLEATGTGVVVRVLTRYIDLLEAMVGVATGAREQLVVTGSRSREKSYLEAIEGVVAERLDLVHYRVLFGPPRHRALSDHLERLLTLRDPSERRNGVKTLHIAMAPVAAMERFFVASERAAVVPLPSFHGADGFDCGVLLGREAAAGLVQHGREASASGRPVETVAAVRALPQCGDGVDWGEGL
ncbi:helix-turn-helix transcriptional regulator [Kitasatospora purpeofusca]|uniref:helix-turn-helix domain-containing protein n=1 Tax=Kitasatospora purpeofusca TaxID=67352 RepID=UPI002A5A38C0|nr:helix-turn-helix transcriptional regulator [Kitasatospora purpeofusca]MDY0810668.1 helix-turn-helix transcriptional regulator [Kitasatospora purpeofusca]